LVGVINNSTFSITGLSLTGNGIGGFDGDGAWSGGALCVSVTSPPFGCPAASGTGDPQNYAGPLTTFPIFSNNAVTVSFNSALGPGGTSYFSLEQNPVVGNIGVGTINPNVPVAPEPSSLMLMASGLAGMAGVIRRKLRR
jgi:hypothetical protein